MSIVVLISFINEGDRCQLKDHYRYSAPRQKAPDGLDVALAQKHGSFNVEISDLATINLPLMMSQTILPAGIQARTYQTLECKD